MPTDVPVAGDFDGDGKTDIAVWRPSSDYWYVVQSGDGAIAYAALPGFTRADQESQIKALNMIVLNGAAPNTTGPLYTLIHGWYDVNQYPPPDCRATPIPPGCLASPTQQSYVPPNIDNPQVYSQIWAPLCRSCHVSNGIIDQDGSLVNPTGPGDMLHYFFLVNACYPSSILGERNGIMPNSKMSFDRFWTTHSTSNFGSPPVDLPLLMQSYYNATYPGGFTGDCTLYN